MADFSVPGAPAVSTCSVQRDTRHAKHFLAARGVLLMMMIMMMVVKLCCGKCFGKSTYLRKNDLASTDSTHSCSGHADRDASRPKPACHLALGRRVLREKEPRRLKKKLCVKKLP